MIEEFNALHANEMWDLISFQLGQNVVGYNWVYRVKFNIQGSVKRHKAILVAFGNHYQASIDYPEAFSLEVKSSTSHHILSIALAYGLTVR